MNSKFRVKVGSGALALCLALFATNVFAQGACKPVPEIKPGESVVGGDVKYTCPVGQGIVTKYNALVPKEEAAQGEHDASQGAAPSVTSAADGVQGGIGSKETAGAGSTTNTSSTSGVQKAAACMGITTPTKAALMAIPPTVPTAGTDAACDAGAKPNALKACEPKKEEMTAECAKPMPNMCSEKKAEYDTCLKEKEAEDLAGCKAYCLAQTQPVAPAATACQGGIEAIGQKCGDLGDTFKGMAEQAAQSMMDQAKKKEQKKDEQPKPEQKKDDKGDQPSDTAKSYNPPKGVSPTSATPNLIPPFSGSTDTVTNGDGSPTGMNVGAGEGVPHADATGAPITGSNAGTGSKSKGLTDQTASTDGSGLGKGSGNYYGLAAVPENLKGAKYTTEGGAATSFNPAMDQVKSFVTDAMNTYVLSVGEDGKETTKIASIFDKNTLIGEPFYKPMYEKMYILKTAAAIRDKAAAESTVKASASAIHMPTSTPQKQ